MNTRTSQHVKSSGLRQKDAVTHENGVGWRLGLGHVGRDVSAGVIDPIPVQQRSARSERSEQLMGERAELKRIFVIADRSEPPASVLLAARPLEPVDGRRNDRTAKSLQLLDDFTAEARLAGRIDAVNPNSRRMVELDGIDERCQALQDGQAGVSHSKPAPWIRTPAARRPLALIYVHRQVGG